MCACPCAVATLVGLLSSIDAIVQTEPGCGETERLILDLSSDDPSIRDDAEARLDSLGDEIGKRLAQVIGSHRDPEVRDRARRIVHRIRIRQVLGVHRGTAFLKAPTAEEKIEQLKAFRYGIAACAFRGQGLEAVLHEIQAHATRPEDQLAVIRGAAYGGMRFLDPLIRDLRDDNLPAIRFEAVAALGGIGTPEALQEAVKLLSSADSDQRLAAVRALLRGGDASLLRELLPLLDDPQTAVREEIIEAIGSLGGQSSVEAIRPMLSDASAAVRTKAIRILAKLQVDPAWIRQALDDPEPCVRVAAIQGLVDLKARDSASEIAARIFDSNAQVTSIAIFALGQLGAVERATDLALLLDSDVCWFHFDAIPAAAEMGAPYLSSHLLRFLKCGDPRLRAQAAEALIKLQAIDQCESIAELLSHPSVDIRSTALRLLTSLEEQAAIPHLLQSLSDPDPHIRSQAIHAIGKLGLRGAVDDIERSLRDSSPSCRADAAAALAVLRAKEHSRSIAALLSDPQEDVRRSALEAIRELHAVDEAPAVAILLSDPSWFIRSSACRTLDDLGGRSFADRVATLLTDENPYVRLSAVWALHRFDRIEDVPGIAALLEDDDAGVRYAVIYTLSKRKNPGLRPRLGQLLSNDRTNRDFILHLIVEMNAVEHTTAAARYFKNSPADRYYTIPALLKLGGREYLAEIAGCLTDSYAFNRTAAIEALVEAKATEYASRIALLLADEEIGIRSRARRALAALKDDHALQTVNQMLNHPWEEVRTLAADLLGEIGDNRALPALRACLAQEPFDVVHRTVQRAIDEINKVKEFMDTYGVNYPMLTGVDDAIDIAKAYGNRFGALPYTVIIDRTGNIAHVQQGELDRDAAVKAIKPLL